MTERPATLLFLVALLAGSLGALAGARLAAPPPTPPHDPGAARRLDELEGTVAELRARLEALEARANDLPPPPAVPPPPAPVAAPPPAAAAEVAAQLDQVRAAQAHERDWRRFLLAAQLTDAQSSALMHACAEAKDRRLALLEKKSGADWNDDDDRALTALTDRVMVDARAILSPDQAQRFDATLCW